MGVQGMSNTVNVVVLGNKLTLDSVQVQGLVDIYDISLTVPEKVLAADAANLPIKALPSFLQVRLKGYYPKTAIANELGMADELATFFKHTEEHERDVMMYGPSGSYTAYCVKQVSEYHYGGDSLAMQEDETSDAFMGDEDDY